mgnify:CR=1 FL=1
MKILLTISLSILLAGCSMFGKSGVENALYTIIKADTEKNIELRNYERLVLVSTSMTPSEKSKKPSSSAFFKLFDYIAGENIEKSKIAMTAPVFMDGEKKEAGAKIPMTAPVFMDENSDTPMMSFVLPKEYTLDTAPQPTNPDVTLSELKNYTVAAIRFSGFLSDNNVEKHKVILNDWIATEGYKIIGTPQKAGYNPPFTLPMFRRNEVLIAVEE